MFRNIPYSDILYLESYCDCSDVANFGTKKSPQLLNENGYSTTDELMKFFKNIQPIKTVQPMKYVQPTKTIQHMENIQVDKSIQHIKIIQHQKINQVFRAIIYGDIFHNNAFHEDIYFSCGKYSYAFTMSSE